MQAEDGKDSVANIVRIRAMTDPGLGLRVLQPLLNLRYAQLYRSLRRK